MNILKEYTPETMWANHELRIRCRHDGAEEFDKSAKYRMGDYVLLTLEKYDTMLEEIHTARQYRDCMTEIVAANPAHPANLEVSDAK